jgi:hypothetical protein
MRNDLLSRGLDADIAMVHERLVAAMDERLPDMSLASKERYFAVLSNLVGKLESPDKALREIAQEMMAETVSIVLQEMQHLNLR